MVAGFGNILGGWAPTWDRRFRLSTRRSLFAAHSIYLKRISPKFDRDMITPYRGPGNAHAAAHRLDRFVPGFAARPRVRQAEEEHTAGAEAARRGQNARPPFRRQRLGGEAGGPVREAGCRQIA